MSPSKIEFGLSPRFAGMGVFLQKILPQHALSRLSGRIAEIRRPWLKNWMIRNFIEKYGVDMSEALESDPTAYLDANSFFTRALKPGLRPIVPGEKNLASPADSCVSAFGKIQQNTLIQAKNFSYSLESLLGNAPDLTSTFSNGHFATLYLGPRDYHRVHMPLRGTLQQMIYVPGKLFSVNQHTAENIPNLFARNERVIAVFSTSVGPLAMVLVGAMFVASIETVWAGTIAPHRPRKILRVDYSKEAPIVLEKGEEMGRFKFGSTVVMILPPLSLDWAPSVQNGQTLKMGALCATVKE